MTFIYDDGFSPAKQSNYVGGLYGNWNVNFTIFSYNFSHDHLTNHVQANWSKRFVPLIYSCVV